MSVIDVKDGSGFWISNRVIDDHLPYIKARGLVLYCMIARCSTLQEYPTIDILKDKLRCSEKVINEVLDKLYDVELLNDYDLKAIKGILIDE